MGRIYRQMFEDVAVSAAQDLVFVPGSTGKMLKVRRAWWGCTDTTAPTDQQVKTRCRILPATVTAGSGGTTGATPSKTDPGDAACSTTTAGCNNTTKATTSGTAIIQDEKGDNIKAGYDMAWPDKAQPPIGPTSAFVLELLSTVSGTVHMSGGVEFEEIG